MSTIPIREIRRLLDRFHDAELDRFCQENFYEVYNNFSRGMRKDEKITFLLDHVIRNNSAKFLLSVLNNSSTYFSPIGHESRLERENIEFNYIKLQLQLIGSRKMRVRGIDVPGGGTPLLDIELPYSANELKAILKAIDVGEYIPSRFKLEYSQSLKELGLLVGNHLHTDLYKMVGRNLFDAIFRDEILSSLQIAQQKGSVICQLLFDPDDVVLSQYPWELIHDGKMFMLPQKSGMEMVRCINISNPVRKLNFGLPLRILYVAPRPKDANYLPLEYEKQSIEMGLVQLLEHDFAQVKKLSSPTFIELEKELGLKNYHILHFDGHGSYSKICPNCHLEHYPSESICRRCKEPIDQEPAYGYLHFESSTGTLDKLNIDGLNAVIANAGIQLIVLTSCNSSVAKDSSILNGIAPGLLQANIPAIIGMQGSPTVEAMNLFVSRFYSELSKGKRIPEAVNSGRLAIFHLKPPAWFMPTVFLRTPANDSVTLHTKNQKGD